MDTYLVIGGEGCVGHAILECLYARYGTSARLFSSSRTRRFQDPRWEFIKSDLTSADSQRDVLKQTGAKTVFLAAASLFESSKDDAYRVNVGGAQAVIEACQSAGVRRLIYTSSTSVVFRGEDVVDNKEDEPYIQENEHKSYYAASKSLAEQLVLAANGQKGLYTCAIRPSGMIGNGDANVLPQAIAVLHKYQAWIQIGDNTNLCDFDHVDNVAYGHILACEHLLQPSSIPSTSTTQSPPIQFLPGPAAGQVFNITTGEPLPMFNFLRKVWYEYNGYRAWFNIVIPLWLGMILAYIYECLFALVGKKATGFNRDTMVYATATRTHSIEKAKEVLGYEPIVSVDEGIKKAVAWYKDEEKRVAQARLEAKVKKRQ